MYAVLNVCYAPLVDSENMESIISTLPNHNVPYPHSYYQWPVTKDNLDDLLA